MSRAFVKEQDGPPRDDIPDRPVSEHPNYVTPSGLVRLKRALTEALERKQALQQSGDAIETESGIAAIDRELRWLEARVASARPIDPAGQPRDRVAFGATVTVADEQGEHRYRIVGEDEAGAERDWVSYVSPLAKALLGRQVGEEVTWRRPAGDTRLEILAIDYEDGG